MRNLLLVVAALALTVVTIAVHARSGGEGRYFFTLEGQAQAHTVGGGGALSVTFPSTTVVHAWSDVPRHIVRDSSLEAAQGVLRKQDTVRNGTVKVAGLPPFVAAIQVGSNNAFLARPLHAVDLSPAAGDGLLADTLITLTACETCDPAAA